MRILVYLDVDDDELYHTGRDLPALKRRLQHALDHEWPYARTESVRVLDVVVQPALSESELIGPLG